MTAEDRANGWWDVPPADMWACPGCGALSSTIEWAEREAYCEDCGDHDGRECPRCGEVLDHVWGAPRIAERTAATVAAILGHPDSPGKKADEA